ncbi:hypothetical protein MLD38_035307 [Melastoma candidum]|uniref:Uncharacterized protein n=1 Tax=Melastoma candidum TaxID=119954 RepID=A0ACB9MCC2_9MYRT|nr:hypothetical protein MLD38_035307 [Melastoma candidum]
MPNVTGHSLMEPKRSVMLLREVCRNQRPTLGSLVAGKGGRNLSKDKKFKSCQTLLQHAIMVSKMARKRAHKALALVVHQVLGWDFEGLLVLERKGQSLSQSLSVPVSMTNTLRWFELEILHCVYSNDFASLVCADYWSLRFKLGAESDKSPVASSIARVLCNIWLHAVGNICSIFFKLLGDAGVEKEECICCSFYLRFFWSSPKQATSSFLSEGPSSSTLLLSIRDRRSFSNNGGDVVRLCLLSSCFSQRSLNSGLMVKCLLKIII